MWVESITEVKQLQRYFLENIGGIYPRWIRRHQEFAKKRRALELEILQKERFLVFMRAAVKRDKDLDRFKGPRQKIVDDVQTQVNALQVSVIQIEVRKMG